MACKKLFHNLEVRVGPENCILNVVLEDTGDWGNKLRVSTLLLPFNCGMCVCVYVSGVCAHVWGMYMYM